MLLLRNHDGVLVNLEKAVSISKGQTLFSSRVMYTIETKNNETDDDSGYLLGSYSSWKERDRAFENLMIFLNAMSMSQFEEERHG